MGQHCVKKMVNGTYEAGCDCNGGRHGQNCEYGNKFLIFLNTFENIFNFELTFYGI